MQRLRPQKSIKNPIVRKLGPTILVCQLQSWKKFDSFLDIQCSLVIRCCLAKRVVYLSVDKSLCVILEVSRPVGDGGEDGAHQEEDGGHDDEDDVAVGGHVKLTIEKEFKIWKWVSSML